MHPIVVAGLFKTYTTTNGGEVRALDGVDLSVEQGEIVALLGPNGAGKTTMVEIMEGFRRPSSGSVSVMGADPASAPRSWRDKVGIVLQETSLDDYLTAREGLDLLRVFYSDPRTVEETLDLVGLDDVPDRRAGELSGGQRRRLDVAAGLIGRPELLFLDEPTTGFDPAARRDSWVMLEGLRDQGMTVVLTTHYMEEAQRLADRIVVLDQGKIVADGSPTALSRELQVESWVGWDAEELSRDALPAELRDRVEVRGDRLAIAAPDDVAAVVSAVIASTANGELNSLSVDRPTLDEVYLRLVESAAQTTVSYEPRQRRSRRTKEEQS